MTPTSDLVFALHPRPLRQPSALWRPIALLTSTFALALGACSPAQPLSCGTTDVVVGLLAPPQVLGQLGGYRVVVRDDRAELARSSWDSSSARPAFPLELPVTLKPDAMWSVEITGTAAPMPDVDSGAVSTEVVLRKSARLFAPGCGAQRLLRIRLDASCIAAPRAPGSASILIPECTPSQTCQSGRCVDAQVDSQSLEPYTKTWPQNESDACGVTQGPAPEVRIGVGQTDYLPLTAGQVLQAEAGPQGGHHVWIAIRMRQLSQRGTVITLTGKQVETGLIAPRTSVVFSFEPDEGGFCKVYGLRYQLDAEGKSIAQFLGKALDLNAELRDPSGRVAMSSVRVQIADSLVPLPRVDGGIAP
jgi:hypothetical protein